MMDPAFLRARKEAAYILLAWAVCLVITVGISWLLGQTGLPIASIGGIPAWVFFGVLVPWALATAFSTWFSLRFMRDE